MNLCLFSKVKFQIMLPKYVVLLLKVDIGFEPTHGYIIILY